MTRESGISIITLVSGTLVAGMSLAILMPNLGRWYQRAKLDGSANTVMVMVQDARLRALKEKQRYRLVFHDTNATNPNRIEMQNDAAGSFAPVGVVDLAGGIELLGSGPTNSMDDMTVSVMGGCTAGDVFLRNPGGDIAKAVIRPACQSSIE